MITYNHERFIEEAINGVLMQEGNFDIELVIVNDCSPDKTEEVIFDVLQKHNRASKIKYIKQEKNIGVIPNFTFALQQCTGKYIAICEGDDYWTDSQKLQKQFNFLETNSDYVIHSGNAVQLSEDSNLNGKTLLKDQIDNSFQLKDFLVGNNIITCTVMFRNIKIEFPADFNKLTFGDWMLYVVLMKISGKKVYRAKECFSVYRIHSGGVMSNLNNLKNYKAHIKQILIIYKYLKIKKIDLKVVNTLNNYYLQIFRIEMKARNYRECLKVIFDNFNILNVKIPVIKYLSIIKNG